MEIHSFITAFTIFMMVGFELSIVCHVLTANQESVFPNISTFHPNLKGIDKSRVLSKKEEQSQTYYISSFYFQFLFSFQFLFFFPISALFFLIPIFYPLQSIMWSSPPKTPSSNSKRLQNFTSGMRVPIARSCRSCIAMLILSIN